MEAIIQSAVEIITHKNPHRNPKVVSKMFKHAWYTNFHVPRLKNRIFSSLADVLIYFERCEVVEGTYSRPTVNVSQERQVNDRREGEILIENGSVRCGRILRRLVGLG